MADMILRFRPLENFPGKRTGGTQSSPFRSTYSDTTDLLAREVEALSADPDLQCVIQLDLTEPELRLDGGVRANARPRSSAVVVSFDSRHGPLQFATDRFTHWHDNLRAIALGLEALRKVDRYGITQGAQQYRGWQQIGDGTPEPADRKMTYEDAIAFVHDHAGIFVAADIVPLPVAYRRAAKKLHPDSPTGDKGLFQRLQHAKSIIDATERFEEGHP